MNLDPTNEQPNLETTAVWQKWLFGIPWWGITVLSVGGGFFSFTIMEAAQILAVNFLSGLFAVVSGLLLFAGIVTLMLAMVSLVGRTMGFAKDVSPTRHPRLVKFGGLLFAFWLALATVNSMLVAIPHVQAAVWTPLPLINHEELWIETPGNWEPQNTKPQVQRFYDPMNDLQILVTAMLKTDMAMGSLEELPKNALAVLSRSTSNARLVDQQTMEIAGRSALVTEVVCDSDQTKLTYLFLHVDLDEHWAGFQVSGLPSQMEKASDKIDQFFHSLHVPE